MGFIRAGICSAEPSRWADELDRWLAKAKHGSMAYMERYRDVRSNPARLLEGGRSFVIVADQYARRGECDDQPNAGRSPRGRIARYARGRDYHRVMKKRLHRLCDTLGQEHPSERFRAFVDTAPVPERELAERAGLGWIGKHTLLIHPRLGSYVLLGGIVTTLALEDRHRTVQADHCGSCTRCIDACPTGAISPYSVDASRCISFLTIERREPIEPSFFTPIGEWLFGCDICQEVCPHNSPRHSAWMRTNLGHVHEAYEPIPRDGDDRGGSLGLLDVLGWSGEDRSRHLSGSAIKRATLAMLKRNALIVAGNVLRRHDVPELRARIERIASDECEDEMVRTTASTVLGRNRST